MKGCVDFNVCMASAFFEVVLVFYHKSHAVGQTSSAVLNAKATEVINLKSVFSSACTIVGKSLNELHHSVWILLQPTQ